MKEYQVSILGMADLLQNAFGGKWQRSDEGHLLRPAVAVYDVYDQEDWRRRLYVRDDGVIYQPAPHIVKALLKAAGMMEMPGYRSRTYRLALDGELFVEPSLVPHRATLADFEAACDAALMFTGPAPKGFPEPVYIHRRASPEDPGFWWMRPALHRWELSFSILLIDRDFPPEVLREIVDLAGCKVGLGDGRPEFGQFAVTRFEAI